MSEVSTSLYNTSRPRSVPRSTQRLRLLRVPLSTKKLWPLAPGMMPELIRPRRGSPRVGCSILITSAPQSANTVPAPGTKNHSAASINRTPSSTFSMDVSLQGNVHDSYKRALGESRSSCLERALLARHGTGWYRRKTNDGGDHGHQTDPCTGRFFR